MQQVNMDLYIAEQFCESKEKINELASLVITPRIPWGEKLEIFKMLITKYNPEFKIKHKKYFDEITFILQHRNVFAHLPAGLSDEILSEYNEKGNILFYKFKTFSNEKTKKIEHSRLPSYTLDSIDAIIISCNFYKKEIRSLLKSVKR